jgi:hypothetical protein
VSAWRANGRRRQNTYPFAIAVVKGLEFDNVGVSYDSHDLQFSILPSRSASRRSLAKPSYLETLVLQDSFDGSVLAAGRQLGLEDDAKRAVADDLALRIGNVSGLASDSVLDSLPYDFCSAWVSSGRGRDWRAGRATYHPFSGC